MTVAIDTRFRVASEVHARDFDEELVILSLHTGDYFGLDQIGARLWNGLVAGKSVEQIAAEITAEYDVPWEKLLADLVTLANDLVGRGLLTVADRV